jgi:hypothetical protein
MQNPTMEPQAMAALLEGITAAHQHVGDPCSSWVVNAALEQMFGEIIPPRSWKKEALRLWATLPYFARGYITAREDQRDAALRRGQNELAAMKQQIKKEQANETQTAA